MRWRESPLSLDTAVLARQVEAAVEGGLEQTLAAYFGAGPRCRPSGPRARVRQRRITS
jgi:hypothetical protein